MADQHAARRAALRERLRALDVDAALITRLVNVGYLSGFTGSNGALLVVATEPGAGPVDDTLATDGRYITQSASQAPDLERLIVGGVATGLVEHAAARGVRRLAFEAHDVTVELHERVTKVAQAGLSAPELVALGRAVEDLRAVKDESEIDALRAACGAADRAFARLLERIRVGRSERDLRNELEALMLEEGGDGPSFETIVAAGPNSAVPHHRPTEQVVARGDFVKFDFGALSAGYHSDMTRTVVVGGPPADWQHEVYALVASAQATGRAAAVVGASSGSVDKAARDVIEAGGHGEHYPHSVGHGVGLEIHEAPTLLRDGSDILRDRMPVTVEPGVYLPGRGGVRIEDTLVVRDGGPELLTTTTKELLIL